jgi:transcriptional regulator with XRE-family HTH domain
MSSRRTPIPSSEPLLDAEHLVARVKARRRSLGFSLREAADAIGVSAASLSRVESGDRLPGRENLLRIAHWLGVRLDLSELPPPARLGRRRSAPQLTTVEAVELYLQADRDLAPAEAEALATIFRVAYEGFKAGRVRLHAPRGAQR